MLDLQKRILMKINILLDKKPLFTYYTQKKYVDVEINIL